MLTTQIFTAHDSSRLAKALPKTLTTSTVTLSMMCLLHILMILTATAGRSVKEKTMTGRKT